MARWDRRVHAFAVRRDAGAHGLGIVMKRLEMTMLKETLKFFLTLCFFVAVAIPLYVLIVLVAGVRSCWKPPYSGKTMNGERA